MNTRFGIGFFLSALFAFLAMPFYASAEKAAPHEVLSSAQKLDINDSFGKLPLYFIKNDGQVDSKVAYYEKGAGHATYFTKDGVWLSLVRKEGEAKENPAKHQSPDANDAESFKSESIRLSFVNANKNPEIMALDEQAGKVNYFVGNDPLKWRSNVPTFASVLYRDVWPGIDIKFYGRNQTLEYDIIVRPGADPNIVKFSYDGIEGLKVADNGDMEILLKEGKVVQKKPYVYQELDNKRMEVAGSFVLSPVLDSYSFEVASFDRTKDLVIDPVLAYSTFLGGGSDDYGEAIAVDSSGNAYVTGGTVSSDFPIANPLDGTWNGSYDAFVTKLNAAGSALVYSTFLGGGSEDYGYGIAVDSSGNAYVTGYAYSPDFPTVNPFDGTQNGNTDVFVAKLNASGSALVYSTLLGGVNDDRGWGIAVDSSGSAYVTGYTYSSNFPTVNPLDGTANSPDAFVTKFSPTGDSLVYSTYLGGTGWDFGSAIAVDSSGSAYVTGWTESSDFPLANPLYGTLNGYIDAFVTKLNASGSALVYSTFLGGGSSDYGYGIAVDSSGSAYVTGRTWSPDFPTANPSDGTWNGGIDAFVTKLDASGSALVYSTYLGGSGNDLGNAIAVDSSGSAYATGYTYSSDFPTVNPFDGTFNSLVDAFVAKLDATGSALVYSTYLGGSGNDLGNAIAVDSSGNAYVTGQTSYSDFPIASPFDGTWNDGPHDAFVTKISDITQYTLTVTKAGTGSGTVTSSPTGINCGTDCSEPYNSGTSVTLTATPATGSVFAGWSGDADCSDGAVSMTGNRACTATFTLIQYTLTVTKAGTGSGTVTSSPTGVNCGTDCSEPYNYNTSVTLTATPATGSVFAGWSGACTGTGNCNVTMSAAKSVTATFTKTWFEETDSKVSYVNTWASYSCTACSAGAIKYSGKTGATATLSFTGTGVKWIAAKAKNLGKAKVYIDGVLKTTVDLYNATTQVKQTVYSVTGLTSGSHTMKIEVTGTKNASSTGVSVDVDAFEVTP